MPVTLDLPTLVLNAGEARAVLTGTVKDKLGWSPECQAADDRLREAVTRLGAALIAAEGMAEALEPFAKEAEAYEPDEGDSRYAAWGYSPLIGDLRTARERLQSYRAHHPQPAAQANEEPAHIFPCDGEGGNDFIRCRTCGQEWAYARTSGPGRPACPQTHQSPGPSAPGHPAPSGEAIGLEPPGCPMPGACACPGGQERLAERAGQFLRERNEARSALATARSEGRAAGLEEAAEIADGFTHSLRYEPPIARVIAKKIRAAQHQPTPRQE